MKCAAWYRFVASTVTIWSWMYLVCWAEPIRLPGTVPAADEGFVGLFDGMTLEGWTVMPTEATADWSVKNGVIVGNASKGRSYLVFRDHDLANFEIKLSYRFPGEGNSGMSIRAQRDETGRRDFKSYHADFGHVGIGKDVLGAWDFHTPGRTEHACFRGNRLVIDENDQPTVTLIPDAVRLSDIRDGGWNEVHVISRGNRFQYFINGKLASEFIEHIARERRLEKGMIQLQLHDPGMTVEFRDIQLKVLK